MTTENIFASGKLTADTVKDLQQNFEGNILMEGDSGYETARKVWNGMIDRKPAVIAQCLSSNDIKQAVKFAQKNNLLVSVKGGGHNVTGNAVCDDGIMIDLSLMRSVKVDPDKQVAEVQTGATWGDFDNAISELTTKGYPVITSLTLPVAKVAFFDTTKEIGVVTEIIGLTGAGVEFLQQLKSGVN